MKAAATGVGCFEDATAVVPASGLVDRALGRAVEGLAATIVVLLCGVISCFAPKSPLI